RRQLCLVHLEKCGEFSFSIFSSSLGHRLCEPLSIISHEVTLPRINIISFILTFYSTLF
uniref:Uncharacterized protein n=1 Tax=Triticum urartu TaxID=4572 RepID=A0A8R7R5S7_TRIUA